MPRLSLTIPHTLEAEEARKRIVDHVGAMRSKFSHEVHDFTESWNGMTGIFTGSIRGFAVNATVTVHDHTVELDGDLPFPASLFKDKFTNVIRAEGEKILQ